jgi:hypothetical protein
MKKSFLGLSLILAMSFLINTMIFAENTSEDKTIEESTYRVVGVGSSLKEAEIDAYQNAIIEFFKNNLTPDDIRTNSSKLLKEFFSLSRIKSYIKSTKIISKEDSGDKVKIVIDLTLNIEKVLESLDKINITPKNIRSKKANREEN